MKKFFKAFAVELTILGVLLLVVFLPILPVLFHFETYDQPSAGETVPPAASEEAFPEDPGEAYPHFYLNGTYYTYRETVSVIPDTFEYAGEITYAIVGNKDFEGNVEGSIYMNEESPDLAYFQWHDWDEDPNAPKDYVIFRVDESWG